MLDYKYLFITQELTDTLNELGYTHFATKDKVDSFEEGRAFYYCIEEKKYGYVDVVPYSEIKNIEQNEEYLKTQRLHFDKNMEEWIKGNVDSYTIIDSELIKSNCCNAPLIENTDICSQCKEHCDNTYTHEDLQGKSFEEQLKIMGSK